MGFGFEGNLEKLVEGKLFLVFIGEGKGGRAPVGGSNGDCNGLGIAIAIVQFEGTFRKGKYRCRPRTEPDEGILFIP